MKAIRHHALFQKTIAGRNDTAQLLRSLEATRAMSRTTLGSYKWRGSGGIPGEVGVENAIHTARRLLDSMDRILVEVNQELSQGDLGLLETTNDSHGARSATQAA